MKDKKQKNQKKNQGKSNKQKGKDSNSFCLSFGKLDLIYKIEFSEQDLEKPEGENNEEKYYNIENFNSLSDLKFIKEKKQIWDKIQLIPNNYTLEQLTFGNKIAKRKMIIDYICYGRPKFEGDEEFFDEIFCYVNEKNNLDINSKPFIESSSYSMTFELSFKKNTHSFSKGNNGGGENQAKQENKDEENGKDYEPNEAMKQGKIPKFSRKNSIFCELIPKYTKYSCFYLNFEDLKEIPGDFEKKDLIELIYFLRKKGSKIFFNFYQPQEEEKEEKKEEEEEEINKNKDNKLANESYDNKGETKEKQEEKKDENEGAQEGENVDEKEEKDMKDLNNLYYLTDLYFFDNKQACKEFDKHYQLFTTDKIKKTINKQKLYDYFISGIASGTKNEVDGDKIGFFLEDFVKYCVVRATKKRAKKNEFDIKCYPKINHNNMSVVEDYKKVIKKNINNYVSIFISFIINGVASSGSTSDEVVIGAFLNALEIIKVKLECQKNDITFNEKAAIKMQLSEKTLAERIKELSLGNQESGFVLDCVNKEKSELKEYVPLYDYHLVYYFRSDITQKQLQKNGFINENGFIMYDPVHRKRMRKDIVKKKLNKEEKQKKVENNIKNINVGSRLDDKEIDSSKINQDKNMETVKKLPKSSFGIVKKKEKNKKGKKRDKINKNEQSGSGSDSSDEEDNKENRENKNENPQNA
jgi:hypothetical protein